MIIYTTKAKYKLLEINSLEDIENFLRKNPQFVKHFKKIIDEFKPYFLDLIIKNKEMSSSAFTCSIIMKYSNYNKTITYTKNPKEWLRIRGFEGDELKKMTNKITEIFIITHWRKEKWIKLGFSEDEAIQKVKEAQSKNAQKFKQKMLKNPENYTDRTISQLGYWLKKGYSEENANLKLKENQSTFSLEKCIQRYGEVEGLKKFNERQEKWQKTLNAKSPEEKQRINKAKFPGYEKSSCISKAEKTLLSDL